MSENKSKERKMAQVTLRDLRNGIVFNLGTVKNQDVKRTYDPDGYCITTGYTFGYEQEIAYNESDLRHVFDIAKSYINLKIQENIDWMKRLKEGISDNEKDKNELNTSAKDYGLELSNLEAKIKHKKNLIPTAQKNINYFTGLRDQLEDMDIVK